jgi:hypothetical protein
MVMTVSWCKGVKAVLRQMSSARGVLAEGFE